jgi:DNA-directed RNA polymerase specialized sigma24 family protein
MHLVGLGNFVENGDVLRLYRDRTENHHSYPETYVMIAPATNDAQLEQVLENVIRRMDRANSRFCETCRNHLELKFRTLLNSGSLSNVTSSASGYLRTALTYEAVKYFEPYAKWAAKTKTGLDLDLEEVNAVTENFDLKIDYEQFLENLPLEKRLALQTLTNDLTVAEAARIVGVSKSRIYVVRQDVKRVAADHLRGYCNDRN